MSPRYNPLIFSGLDFAGSGGPAGAPQWKAPVSTEAALPTINNTDGDACVVLDTDKIYVWDADTSKWIDSKLTTAAFGATPNANGLTVSSVTEGNITRATINLEPADATNPGAVSIAAQPFAGSKTFLNQIQTDGGIDVTATGGNDILNIGVTNANTVNIGNNSASVNIDGAVNIDYTPSAPTNWAPAPDDVIEALDQLASRFVEQDDVTKEPTGFLNRTTSTLSFSDSAPARTFTITPIGEFYFYVKGKKFKKTSAESIVISADAGDHYIYYDGSGVLQESTDPDFVKTIISEYAYVAVVYWNTDTSTHTYFGDERHGLVMDGATHGYLHTVFGARFLSGLALNFSTIPTTVDGTGNSSSNAQFPSDQGKIRDEDILHEIPVQSQIPILYRQGSLWRKKAADAYPLIYQGTAGYGAGLLVPFNKYNGTWTLTAVQSSKFVLVHYFGTNDIDNPFIGIQGIAEYNSIEDARTNANTEISSLSGLPFTEFVPVGSVIFQTATAYTNTPKARIRSTDTGANYVDFRGSQLYTPAGTATTHGLLSGLGNDDHFQYLLANGTRAMSGALDMGTHQINNVTDPSVDQDAATKNYVDTEIASAVTGATSYFAGFDPTTGVLTEVPGYVFYDDGSLEIGAQNSITIPSGIDEYISIGISPTVSNSGLNTLSGVQLNSPINTNINNYNGFQVFGYGTNRPNNFTAYRSQTSYTSAGTSITHFAAGGASNCTGVAKGFEFSSAGDAGTIQGVALYPSGDANTIDGLVFQPSGAYTDTTGIKVDLSNATITNRPVGLDISGGTLGSATTFNTVSNFPSLVDSCNVIRPIFEVHSGSAITGTDVLMTNLAGFMDFKDNHSGTGFLDLGVASVGFVSQVAVDAAKTADSISMCLAGLAVDATSAGGSVADAHLYRGSAFTFGGSLTIDNLYGLKIENTLSDKATNSWGISVEDSGSENYLAKSLAIGTPTKKVADTDTGIEIHGPKTLKIGSATTAQRTAISDNPALLIFDSDNSHFYINNGANTNGWAPILSYMGDIPKTQFTFANNQSSAANVNGFIFDSSIVATFTADVFIVRGSGTSQYNIQGVYNSTSSDWFITQEYVGSDVGVSFSITASGQVQYTSSNTGFGGTIIFKATTI